MMPGVAICHHRMLTARESTTRSNVFVALAGVADDGRRDAFFPSWRPSRFASPEAPWLAHCVRLPRSYWLSERGIRRLDAWFDIEAVKSADGRSVTGASTRLRCCHVPKTTTRGLRHRNRRKTLRAGVRRARLRPMPVWTEWHNSRRDRSEPLPPSRSPASRR